MSGAPVPELRPDSSGTLAFNSEMGGYAFSALYSSAISEEDALILVDLGPVAPLSQPEAYKFLLKMNLGMTGVRVPVVGLSENDSLMLKLMWPLAETSGVKLLDCLNALAGWGDTFRSGGWLRRDNSTGALVEAASLA